jgi:short chain dehydrogenase
MGEDKLTGKVAIVFGGSRGIGAAAARRLAKEGANVGLTYVSAPDKAADTVRAIEDQGRQRRSNGDPRRRHPGGSPPWSSRHRCRQRGYPTTGRSSSRKLAGTRPYAERQREGRFLGHPGGRGAFLRGRPRDHHRQQHRGSKRLSWIQCLRGDPGRGGRHGQGDGGGPRSARHHREQYPAGANAHGHDRRPHR